MSKNRIIKLSSILSKKSAFKKDNSPTSVFGLFKYDELYQDYISNINPKDLIILCLLTPVEDFQKEKAFDVISSKLFVFTYYTVDSDDVTEDCDDCGGSGENNCDECNGNGSEDCNTCDGNGDVDCDYCDGTGEDEEGDECGNCNGSGRENCNDCGGSGSNDCSWCGGSGQETCGTCNGAGDTTKEDYYEITQYFIASWDDKILNQIEMLDIDDVMGDDLISYISGNKKCLVYDTNHEDIESFETLNVNGDYFYGYSTNSEFRQDSGHIVDKDLEYKS